MRKYLRYSVRVLKDEDQIELEVSTNRDKSNYKEMVSLYNETKEKVKNGTIKFIGFKENNEEYELFSKKNKNLKKVDEVVNNLIDNINWLSIQHKNSSHLMQVADSTRDMKLKKIELFDDLELNEEQIIQSKIEIFDEIQEILKIRREVKYQNILINRIFNNINVSKLLKDIEDSRNETLKKPSIDLNNSKPIIAEEYDIDSLFTSDTVSLIANLTTKHEKVFATNSKVLACDKKKKELEELIESKIIYEGKSYKKLKKANNGIKLETKIFQNIKEKEISSFIANHCQKFNIMERIGNDIHCHKYVQNYKGYAVIQKLPQYKLSTKERLSQIYKTEIVNNILYCLKEVSN